MLRQEGGVRQPSKQSGHKSFGRPRLQTKGELILGTTSVKGCLSRSMAARSSTWRASQRGARNPNETRRRKRTMRSICKRTIPAEPASQSKKITTGSQEDCHQAGVTTALATEDFSALS